jgi:hypothetical protein
MPWLGTCLRPAGNEEEVFCNCLKYMAERVGFEPTEGFPSTVFKTAAFDHSATSPMRPQDTGIHHVFAST